MVGMMRGYGEKMAVYLRAGNEMNAALVEYVKRHTGHKSLWKSGLLLWQILKIREFLS